MPLDHVDAGLTDEQIRTIAPSVFSLRPDPRVSNRYAYIPSYQSLRQLRVMGLVPVKARESLTKNGVREYAMHEIRFRKGGGWPDSTKELGQLIPEVVLRNSHDLSSPLSFNGGLHRLVCLNGMTVVDQGMSFTIRHMGRNVHDQVHTAVTSIVGHFARVVETARSWSNIRMSPGLQRKFVLGALDARGTSLDVADPLEIIKPQRPFDIGDDLWRVFNRAQENLTRGVRASMTDRGGTGRRLTPIRTLARDVEFNRKLWTLASDLAHEVTAGTPVVRA